MVLSRLSSLWSLGAPTTSVYPSRSFLSVNVYIIIELVVFKSTLGVDVRRSMGDFEYFVDSVAK